MRNVPRPESAINRDGFWPERLDAGERSRAGDYSGA
jgi:hypothetical protein